MTKYAEQTHRLTANILTCKDSKIHELRLVLREIRMLTKVLSSPQPGSSDKNRKSHPVKDVSKIIDGVMRRLDTSPSRKATPPKGDAVRAIPTKDGTPSDSGVKESPAPQAISSEKKKRRRSAKKTIDRKEAPTRNRNFPHHPSACPFIGHGNLETPGPTDLPMVCKFDKCDMGNSNPFGLFGYTGPQPSQQNANAKGSASNKKSSAASSAVKKLTATSGSSTQTGSKRKNKSNPSSQKAPAASENTVTQGSTPKANVEPETQSNFACACANWLAKKQCSKQTIGHHAVIADCQRWRAKVGKVAKAQADARNRRVQQDENRDKGKSSKLASSSGKTGGSAKSAKRVTVFPSSSSYIPSPQSNLGGTGLAAMSLDILGSSPEKKW